MGTKIEPKASQRKPSIFDANSTVADQWTEKLIQAVLSLGDSPRDTYLKQQFLTKFMSSDTDPAELRRQRAISKWLATEARNIETNERLDTICEEFNILPRVPWHKFLSKVQQVIVDLLGETVPEDALVGVFSGGASTSRKRTESYPASKYIGQADITSAAIPWFKLALDHLEGWTSYRTAEFGGSPLRVVDGNVMFTVPKTTDIDRCACKEPELNMFLQRGVGLFIRSKLRRVGINLRDQSRNRDLAREGSWSGELATLDLSSASDSVTTSLIELVLPIHWYTYLNALRSPKTDIDGEEHVNAMFSSMGNGFTFELQTLVFYAIAKATAYFEGARGVISVYGDDMIVPASIFNELSFVLGVCGFQVNPKKSYFEGPFRESCGGHYWLGSDITPFYLRKPISKLTDLIQMANAIRLWSGRDGCSILCDSLYPLWVEMRDAIPKSLWGGRQLGSITQLVTPELGRKALVAVEKQHRTGLGGYLHWLNLGFHRRDKVVPSNWRDFDPENPNETSVRTETLTRYRTRPVPKHSDGPLVQVYLAEV